MTDEVDIEKENKVLRKIVSLYHEAVDMDMLDKKSHQEIERLLWDIKWTKPAHVEDDSRSYDVFNIYDDNVLEITFENYYVRVKKFDDGWARVQSTTKCNEKCWPDRWSTNRWDTPEDAANMSSAVDNKTPFDINDNVDVIEFPFPNFLVRVKLFEDGWARAQSTSPSRDSFWPKNWSRDRWSSAENAASMIR